jgi:hypothetical protein
MSTGNNFCTYYFTCDRLVVFCGYFGFLHQYNWNIVESVLNTITNNQTQYIYITINQPTISGLTKPGEVGDFFALVSMKSPNFCQSEVLVALSVFSSPYFFHQ